MIRDPGSEIRDPEKIYSGSRIPDPGVKKHPIPDPGSRIRIRNTAVLWIRIQSIGIILPDPDPYPFQPNVKSFTIVFQKISIYRPKCNPAVRIRGSGSVRKRHGSGTLGQSKSKLWGETVQTKNMEFLSRKEKEQSKEKSGNK